ncbi:MAG TPA: hypothetical protein VK498_07645 [Ferruginibacter sp.]|nr:hypothetical protein [Ferruginibacter sp.]
MTIPEYCEQLSQLLAVSNEADKSIMFLALSNQYKSDKRETVSKLKALFTGGMGSFNDLVLYKEGKVDFPAMEKLVSLRDELYKAVVEKIIAFRRADSGY